MFLKILQISTGSTELSYPVFVRPSGVLQNLSITAEFSKALAKQKVTYNLNTLRIKSALHFSSPLPFSRIEVVVLNDTQFQISSREMVCSDSNNRNVISIISKFFYSK